MPQKVPSARKPLCCDPAEQRRIYERSPMRVEDRAFYQSQAWLRLRRAKLRANPLCERCKATGRIVAATMVHHVVERKADASLALNWENTESLCGHCHSAHHSKLRDR